MQSEKTKVAATHAGTSWNRGRGNKGSCRSGLVRRGSLAKIANVHRQEGGGGRKLSFSFVKGGAGRCKDGKRKQVQKDVGFSQAKDIPPTAGGEGGS